ncbi:MAG TPA: hypothetical protein VGD30_15520 [Telluria sp.]
MYLFIENNWLSILSIIIGILVSCFFFWLQQKQGASATAERKKRATVELLDVVESYIINKQRLSEQVIDNLIYASERDHVVDLRPACTAVSLLQDVALRLQRSRHLDIPQKSDYSEAIELLIREIRTHREPLRAKDLDEKLSRELVSLLNLLPYEKATEAQQLLTTITTRVQKRAMENQAKHTKDLVAASISLLFGVLAMVTTGVLGNKAFAAISSDALASTLAKVSPVFGVTMLGTLVLAALVIAIRARKTSLGLEVRLRQKL